MIDAADRHALIDATTRAAKAVGGLPPFDVMVDKVEGSIARVRLEAQSGGLTPLYGFGFRLGKAWMLKGGFGTFFGPEFYAANKVPPSMQL